MQLHKFPQITDVHCGPAVIQMLLDGVGLQFSQEEITRAAGAEFTIKEHGTRVDQLALATARLAPQMKFWYKYHATIEDVKTILRMGYGVGVEWQGLFYNSEEEEAEDYDSEDADRGHYSVISYLDEEQEQLIIVDPYREFVQQDRIIPVDMFLRRWWDTNEVTNPYTGQRQYIKDEQLLFFIKPSEEAELGSRGIKLYASNKDPYNTSSSYA